MEDIQYRHGWLLVIRISSVSQFRVNPFFQLLQNLLMDENLKNLNSQLASYEKVSQIQIYPTEFIRTPTRKIKRYLYDSIAANQEVEKK